jgi:hypothetical protein
MTLCTTGNLPAGFVATGGDCAPLDPATWQTLAYSFRDVDGDGAVVPEIGLLCSGAALPPSYLTSAPTGRPFDCDDANPAVSVGLTVFADADGDGVTAPAMGLRCTAGALLPPYFAVPSGNDCDDTNPDVSVALTVFADGDGDGFGAGPAQPACTSGAPPPGFSTAGTDCDDTDAAAWALVSYRAIDNDGDGITVPATGQLCTNGMLPAPFKATANGNDCDDDNPDLTHLAVLYPDLDGDGVGAPPRQITCIGTAIPSGLSRGGHDDDDTDPDVIEVDDDDLELLLFGE